MLLLIKLAGELRKIHLIDSAQVDECLKETGYNCTVLLMAFELLSDRAALKNQLQLSPLKEEMNSITKRKLSLSRIVFDRFQYLKDYRLYRFYFKAAYL